MGQRQPGNFKEGNEENEGLRHACGDPAALRSHRLPASHETELQF